MEHLRDQWRLAAMGRLYHFTTRPDFEIDPLKRPLTRLRMETGVPALYVTDDPKAWWTIWGKAQKRAYVAEIVPVDPDWRRFIRTETKAPDPEESIIILAIPGAPDAFKVDKVLTVAESQPTWPASKWRMPPGFEISDWAKA